MGNQFATGPNKRPVIPTRNYDECLRLYRGSFAIAAGVHARSIASRQISVKRRLATKAGVTYEDVSPNHLLCETLECPNEYDTSFDLHFKTILLNHVFGDAYLLKSRNGFGVPHQITPLYPQWVNVVPALDRFIAGYRINAWRFGTPGWDVDQLDIIRLQNFSVDGMGDAPLYGVPTSALAEDTVELEAEMFTRVRHKLNNYAKPGLIFGTKEQLGPIQLEQNVHEIWSQHHAVEKTGMPMVVHTGMELLAGGDNNKSEELDYLESLQATQKLNSSAVGVPLSVLGLVADTNRASAEAAMYTYATNIINPDAVRYGQRLTKDLARDYEEDLEIFIAPLDTNSRQDVIRAVEACWRSGAMTPDEIRDFLMNLPAFKKGGDRPILPAGSMIADYGNDPHQEDSMQAMEAAGIDTNGLAAQSSRN
jgi:phage portal protein BeeE